jgi:hypothetical protein
MLFAWDVWLQNHNMASRLMLKVPIMSLQHSPTPPTIMVIIPAPMAVQQLVQKACSRTRDDDEGMVTKMVLASTPEIYQTSLPRHLCCYVFYCDNEGMVTKTVLASNS